MDIRNRLQANCENLLENYHENLQDVISLQTTLINDILPSVVDELELAPHSTEWAKEWLSDTPSMFRISRRNKFIRSFALESVQKNLIWRLNNLWPLVSPSPTPNVHCLPDNIRDPFGRPILVIETIPINEPPETFKTAILLLLERLRTHLNRLYHVAGPGEQLPLQYIILLDLKGVSLQSLNVDLMTWTLRELIPRFPGMLAGVFLLNYSWAHSGMWSIVKRLLPDSALSRVFFPSQEDLLLYFTPSVLPKDYGGGLPFMKDLEDPLRIVETPSMSPAGVIREHQRSIVGSLPPPEPPSRPSITSISSTSLLNPFFGYPASSSWSRGPPSLHHGRRRKRDLALTLVRLFWIRWKKHITAGVFLAALFLIIRLCIRRGFIGFLRGARWRFIVAPRYPTA